MGSEQSAAALFNGCMISLLVLAVAIKCHTRFIFQCTCDSCSCLNSTERDLVTLFHGIIATLHNSASKLDSTRIVSCVRDQN